MVLRRDMPERGPGAPASVRERARRWAPASVLIAATVAALLYVLPKDNRNPLLETTVWSLLVLEAFAGWGSLVRLLVARARAERVDLGLRILWGASAVCFIGGALATLALMTRGAAFLLVEVGVVLAIATLVLERDAVRRKVAWLVRVTRREPRLATVGVAVVALVALHYCAGIAEWHTNPYDDDIAYLAFARKMLDTGTLIEPFSLRRLSSLGGQTLFLELVSVRAAPSQAHTFDRSMCVAMVVLLVSGYRTTGGRRVPWLVAFATIALFLMVPNASINTASYYSGVAFFLGLFRTIVWLGRKERAPWQSALPIALVGAATCTLRQNYIAVPAATLGVMYASRFFASREPIRARLAEPAFAAVASLVALLPWFIVAWHSNHTFFYPVMLGTANRAMQFQSGASTPLREIYLQIWTLLEGVPLKTIGCFIIAAAVVRERDPRKPLWSLLLGCAAGYVALIHGLTQGDAGNIGRYAYGFLMALALAVVLVSTTARLGLKIGREHVAAGLTMFGVLAGLVDARTDLHKYYLRATRNIETLATQVRRSPHTVPAEVPLYQRLQASVPEGARIAVLLDEPYHLDFARNPIWNLDMPGYSSLPPGIPYFQGSDRVESYFRGLGVRYLAYVTIGYSRYHYRRDYWIQEVVDEQEVWRAHAPYVIDFMDNLTAMDGRHRRVFEERGLVVMDLEAPR
jgi:hypothetical protein